VLSYTDTEMKKVKEFLNDLKKIIKEITWPNKETLIQLTVVVILVSIVSGAFLGAADFGFTKLISLITLR